SDVATRAVANRLARSCRSASNEHSFTPAALKRSLEPHHRRARAPGGVPRVLAILTLLATSTEGCVIHAAMWLSGLPRCRRGLARRGPGSPSWCRTPSAACGGLVSRRAGRDLSDCRRRRGA